MAERATLVKACNDQISYGISNLSKRSKHSQKHGGESAIPPEGELVSKDVDGKEHKVRLTPQLFGGFLGAEPPGGWYGPFGFLRLVAYGFIAGTGIASLNLLYAIYCGESFVTIFFSLLLIVGTGLAATAAYSHEGLANQVSVTARHNDQYAKLNDDLHQQTSALQEVEKRFQELLGGSQQRLEELDENLRVMTRLKLLSEGSTVAQGFISAETQSRYEKAMRGEQDDSPGLLQGVSEVKPFWDSCRHVLEANTKMNVKGFMKRAAKVGMTSREMALLLGAINTDFENEEKCFVGLAEWYMDPLCPDRLAEVSALLVDHLAGEEKFGNPEAVEAELKRMLATVGDGERVPKEETTALTKAVLHCFDKDADDDSEDLGVSDDED